MAELTDESVVRLAESVEKNTEALISSGNRDRQERPETGPDSDSAAIQRMSSDVLEVRNDVSLMRDLLILLSDVVVQIAENGELGSVS